MRGVWVCVVCRPRDGVRWLSTSWNCGLEASALASPREARRMTTSGRTWGMWFSVSRICLEVLLMLAAAAMASFPNRGGV